MADNVFEVGELVYFDEGFGLMALRGVGTIARAKGTGYRVKTMYPFSVSGTEGEVFMFPTELKRMTLAEFAVWRIKHGSR